MKIQDLIQLEKKLDLKRWDNQAKKDYFNKHGYFFQIPSHSADESVLLNNYEKECVVAYIKNKYLTIFLIKTARSYKGFVHIGEVLKIVNRSYTYEIGSINDHVDTLKFLKQDEENLIVVDEEKYNQFSKFILLEGLK